ncbi:cell division protein FtsA [Alphaproteobacteria bacterium]|jgi:cell division protein FtsA|nr:cell division protein FtsA [Alphaproteobacteria bacterium]
MNQRVDPAQLMTKVSAVKRETVAVLDVGTSKITCLIVELPDASEGENARPIVIGMGYQISQGVSAGQITDMVAAERSIRLAVDQAERRAGIKVRKIHVGVSAIKVVSQLATAEVTLNGQVATSEHLSMVLRHAVDELYDADYDILHAIPVNYAIDESNGISDPRGMVGQVMRVNVHIVKAPIGPLQNMRACIERCHLECEKLVFSPYASALASLNQDEMDLGVLHIEMGGGSTSFSVFYENKPIYIGVVPVGAHHVTRDLARGLNIPLASAERIKNLFGSALATGEGGHEEIELPNANDSAHIVQHHMLTNIIRPRLEETFEMVNAQLERSGLAEFVGRRAVLTGGGAAMSGARELAQHILERDVRVATPMRLNGLPDMATGPAFSASAGIVAYMRRRQTDQLGELSSEPFIIERIFRWLRRNF